MSKSRNRSARRQKTNRPGNRLPLPLLLVAGGILLIGGALFALWKSGQPTAPKIPIEISGAPGLKVDQERVDLGDVPMNKMVTVSFQLANTGDQPLRFSKPPYVEVVEGC